MNRWRSRLAELQDHHVGAPSAVQNVQIVQNPPPGPTFEHFEQIERRADPEAEPIGAWSDAEEERAAIIEYDGGAPKHWAESLARLDPARPPSDMPPRRWVQFIDDAGRFIDGGWPDRATALGWRALDIFGCDRERPYARVDRAGLLWLINGGKLVAMSEHAATIERPSGMRQTFRRVPVEAGRIVLAWELQP